MDLFFFFAKKAYKKGFWTKLNSSHSRLTQIQFKLTKYDFTVAVLICLSNLWIHCTYLWVELCLPSSSTMNSTLSPRLRRKCVLKVYSAYWSGLQWWVYVLPVLKTNSPPFHSLKGTNSASLFPWGVFHSRRQKTFFFLSGTVAELNESPGMSATHQSTQ